MADDKKIIFSMVGVSKSFQNNKQVLKDIYLSFFYGAKIGIIGLNGSGKSTLMKIIAGLEKNYQGEVVFSPGYSVGYLAQEPHLDDTKTVKEVVMEGVQNVVDTLAEYEEINNKFGLPEYYEDPEKMDALFARQAELQDIIDATDAWNLDSKLERAMDALRCPPEDQPVKNLSGGERRRVALCRLLLQKPDILLLDEPTNHLDAESIDWLEQHLQQYEGTVIAVTHDRYFLDHVAGWILELDRGEGIPWKGNYSSWLEQKTKRMEMEEKTASKRRKTLERELEWVRMGLSPEMQMAFMKNGLVGDVSATLPLFTGGQIVNGNKLAKVNVEVNRLQQRQSQNEVTLTVENYFWQVVMLKEKLQTISTLDKQLTQLLQDVETSVQAGVTTRNDLLQVQLRQNEIQSKRIQAENMLSLSRSMLAQYIGHPADSIEVAATLKDTLPQGPEGLYTPPEAALATTNEYNLLQQNVKASSLQHKMAIGKNLPTIAIGGGYAYENLLGKDHTFWLGFATVSVPISGWWGGSHDIQRQKLQLRNAENQLADQSQLLVIRIKHTWDDLNDANKQVKIALLSIEQAKENLRLNTDYYAAGTCTMSDLLDAQSLYQQSRDKYVEIYAQYEVKKREYLQVTGR